MPRTLREALVEYERLLVETPAGEREVLERHESSLLRLLGIYLHSVVHYSTGDDAEDMRVLRDATHRSLVMFLDVMEGVGHEG
jgi:hypothetical protein